MNSRNVIFFSFLQLSAKDQLFIKSLLAIYKQRAKKIWEHQANPSLSQVVFLGEHGKNQDRNLEGIKPYQYVILLSEEMDIFHTRLFKVNPREFSGKILEAIEKCETALMGKTALISHGSDNALRSRALLHGQDKDTLQFLKLLKWPSMAFIRIDANYAVLATLIMSKKLSLNELVQKSGFNTAYCTRFMHEAESLGYIEVTTEKIEKRGPHQAQESSPEKLGLFARIRSRLGLRRAKDVP